MPYIFIIAGCNGAGKTTASFTVLPEMLNCDVFVNADEIARGLSPLNPERSAIDAGRLMLNMIDKLIVDKKDFAFETTLSSKGFTKTILRAIKSGYQVTLIFFWLDSVELACERVRLRVDEGGHNIPAQVISRRYISGLRNLFNLYIPICDYWMIFDNSGSTTQIIAEGYHDKDIEIINYRTFDQIKRLAQNDKEK